MITQEVVSIRKGVADNIRRHACSEADKGGYEAVGFLARRSNQESITAVVRLANHCSDPTTGFFVEPWEQFRAERKLAEAGYLIAGVYHSHPASEALPSGTDEAMARPGELMVIYAVAFNTLTAWREQEGRLVGVGLDEH